MPASLAIRARRGLAWATAATLALLAPGPSSAAGRFVATNGYDFDAGTIDAPWRSPAVAISRLVPGDTLYFRAGRYYHWNLAATVSGTAGAPIVIRSYPGEVAIIDPTQPAFRTPGNNEWQAVDAGLGLYTTRNSVYEWVVLSWVAGIPGYENERLRLTPYPSHALLVAPGEAYDSTAFYAGPGTFEPNNRLGTRLAKTAEVRAAEQRYGRVFDEDVPHPRDYSMIVTGSTYSLRIAGSYLVFKDLVLEPSYHTVYLAPDVHDVVLDGMTLWVGRNGISVGGLGVHHITVTRCRIYGDCPAWVFRSDADSDVPPAPAQRLRTTSIDLSHGTHDWEISYNHIRGSAQYLIEARLENHPALDLPIHGLAIHHNRLENAAEDALRFESGASLGRIEIYENFVSNCLRAVTAGKYTPSFDGPMLIYRNVVSLLRDPAVNRIPGLLDWNDGLRHGYEYMFNITSPGGAGGTQNAHLYHNTLVLLNSAGKGIHLGPTLPADGRLANNLMVLVNGRVNDGYHPGIDQVVDGNLYWKMNTVDAERLVDSYDTVPVLASMTNFELHGVGSVPKRGTDPAFAALNLQVVDPSLTRWAITPESERTQPWHFVLSASSPARDAGIVIPPHPTIGAMPDSRISRDIGALPYGTTAADFAFFPFDPAPNPAPLVNAGPDQTHAPPSAPLQGTASDDGHPTTGAFVTRWSMVSGPGQARFANPNALATEVTFTAGGAYVLRLTASDGERTVSDDVTIVTALPFASAESQATASTDDADEGGPGNISLASGALHLGVISGTPKTTGTRFTGVAIPRGATVIGARLQFSSYGTSTEPAQFMVVGQASDHADPFAATTANLTSRPKTAAAVNWTVPAWGARYIAGPNERSPDLAAIVQEIVDRPGWSSGNAIALFTAGTGSRSAVSADYPGGAGAVLHVDFVPPGSVGVAEAPGRERLHAVVSPSPAAGSSTLRFTLPRPGPALAELFDVRGRRVRVLVDSARLEAGAHEARIGGAIQPGVYFYRVRAAGETTTGRCLFLR